MMKVLISILLFSGIFFLESSSKSNDTLCFFGGYGYYEGINAGIGYKFSYGTQNIGLSFGVNKLFDKNSIYYSIISEYNIAVFRKHITRYGIYKWYIGGRIVYWYFEDEYYIFNALSFIPNFGRQFSLGEKFSMAIDGGIAFNLVLTSERKTFEEVGWPYNVMPDIRILIKF